MAATINDVAHHAGVSMKTTTAAPSVGRSPSSFDSMRRIRRSSVPPRVRSKTTTRRPSPSSNPDAESRPSIGFNSAQGPLNASLVYNNRNNDVAATGTTPAADRENGKNTLLAVNYDFKVVKVFAAFERDKGLNSSPIPVANAFGYSDADLAALAGRQFRLGRWRPGNARGIRDNAMSNPPHPGAGHARS